MTHEQFEREKQYRIAMAIAKTMLKKGIIDDQDCAAISTIFIEKFQPILSGLYPKTT